MGRKPRWDRPTRSGGEPQRGFEQESGVGYSDRGPEGDPGCHQFGGVRRRWRQGKVSAPSSALAVQHFNSSQQTIVNQTLKSTHQISGILTCVKRVQVDNGNPTIRGEELLTTLKQDRRRLIRVKYQIRCCSVLENI